MGWKSRSRSRFHPGSVFWEVHWWPTYDDRPAYMDEVQCRTFNNEEEGLAMTLAEALREQGWAVHVSRLTREPLKGWSFSKVES